jgi:hypothetical protein
MSKTFLLKDAKVLRYSTTFYAVLPVDVEQNFDYFEVTDLPVTFAPDKKDKFL